MNLKRKRTWTSLSPETRCVISIKRWWVQIPIRGPQFQKHGRNEATARSKERVKFCHPIAMCVCVGGCFPYAKQFSDISWESYNSTQFWYLPEYSARSHRLRSQSYKTAHPPAHFRHQIKSPGCHLCFWPINYKSEVPTTPYLGLINLLEWLTELRKAVYSLDYWFIIKGYIQLRNNQMKRCVGQRMGERMRSFHAL